MMRARHLGAGDLPGQPSLTHAHWIEYLEACAARWRRIDEAQATRVLAYATAHEDEATCVVCHPTPTPEAP